jgi:hypothetical protein
MAGRWSGAKDQGNTNAKILEMGFSSAERRTIRESNLWSGLELSGGPWLWDLLWDLQGFSTTDGTSDSHLLYASLQPTNQAFAAARAANP